MFVSSVLEIIIQEKERKEARPFLDSLKGAALLRFIKYRAQIFTTLVLKLDIYPESLPTFWFSRGGA